MDDIIRDRASVHEKIMLACNNIQWHNYQLSQLIAGSTFAATMSGNKQFVEQVQAANEAHNAVLEQALQNLSTVLEAVGNYVNGIDAVTKIDIRVTTPGNEIVLLGMDELEKDYDDEERRGLAFEHDINIP
jgi:enamine deaminase RidA (YjgF/YER057c/UK114 family)